MFTPIFDLNSTSFQTPDSDWSCIHLNCPGSLSSNHCELFQCHFRSDRCDSNPVIYPVGKQWPVDDYSINTSEFFARDIVCVAIRTHNSDPWWDTTRSMQTGRYVSCSSCYSRSNSGFCRGFRQSNVNRLSLFLNVISSEASYES